MFGAILLSPFWNDDQPNSMRAAVLRYSNETPMQFFSRMVNQWRINEGRFFPVSTIENLYTFVLFNSRFSFKVLQLSSLLLVASLLGALIWQLTQRWEISIAVSIMFLILLQIRMWFDPTIGFGLLLQSVSIKFLIVFILSFQILKTKNKRNLFVFCLLTFIIWLLAVFQYEITIFVWPLIPISVCFAESASWARRLTAIFVTAVPTAVAIVVSLVMRSGVSTSASYKISIGGDIFWITLIKQIAAALPLNTSIFLGYRIWSVKSSFVFVLISACLFFVFKRIALGNSTISSRNKKLMCLIGGGLAILPAVPVAISEKWQLQLSWGNGYLPVFFQYIGISILLLVIVVWLIEMSASQRPRNRTLIIVMISMVLGGIAGVHSAGTADVVWRTQPFTWQRELFEQSVRDGFFDVIPADSSIISTSYSPNEWFNPWSYQWFGGSKTHLLSGTESGMVVACTEAQKIGQCYLEGPWWGFQELIVRERLTIEAIGKYIMLDHDPMTTELVPRSIQLSTRDQEFFPSKCRLDMKKTMSGNWTSKCDETVTSFKQINDLLQR